MRAKKVDANHAEIRDSLRKSGRWVFDTHDVGRGFPDLLVALPGGFMCLLEVKDGKKKRLNDAQKRLMSACPGVVLRVDNPEDAELQIDLAEKYTFLRHPPAFIERPEDYTPPPQGFIVGTSPAKPKPRSGSKLLDMLAGE